MPEASSAMFLSRVDLSRCHNLQTKIKGGIDGLKGGFKGILGYLGEKTIVSVCFCSVIRNLG